MDGKKDIMFTIARMKTIRGKDKKMNIKFIYFDAKRSNSKTLVRYKKVKIATLQRFNMYYHVLNFKTVIECEYLTIHTITGIRA